MDNIEKNDNNGMFIQKVIYTKGKSLNFTYKSNHPSDKGLEALADCLYQITIKTSTKLLDT
jgi:hypothetical protein